MSQLEDRLDEMREQLELWVLRAAAETIDPSGLRGLLHLGAASEEVGDAAQQLVWLVEEDEEMHPVLAVALGETDDVVVQYPVAVGSRARPGRAWAEPSSETTPGSTCSRSGAAAATCTGRAVASCSRPVTRCWRAARETVVARWPSSAGSGSSKTTTPARSSSSPSRNPVRLYLVSGSGPRLERDRDRREADDRRRRRSRARASRPCGPASSLRRVSAPATMPADVTADRDVRLEEAEHEVDREQRPEAGVHELHAAPVHDERGRGGHAEDPAARAAGELVRRRDERARRARRAPTRRRSSRSARVR